jgi:hypothetical protein
MLAGHVAGAIVREAFLTSERIRSEAESGMSKTLANFIQALAAVLAGNAAYFLLVRYLPPQVRHVPFRIDLGLVVDFWLCLVAFGMIKTLVGWRRDSNRPRG